MYHEELIRALPLGANDQIQRAQRPSITVETLLAKAENWLLTFLGKGEPKVRGHAQNDVSANTADSNQGEPLDVIVDLTGRQSHIQESDTHRFSIRFYDNQLGVSGPPGFWASFLGAPTTSVALYLGDQLVFTGSYKTQRLFSLNRRMVLREGLHDIGEVLQQWLKANDHSAVPKTSPLDETTLWVYKKPKAWHVVTYLAKTLLREGAIFFRRIRGFEQRFSVGICSNAWDRTDFTSATFLPNPEGRYYADPLLIEKEGRTVCFVEDYSYETDRGRIVAFELSESGHSYLGPVVEESHHLSFPFVFSFQDELYMIPETYQTGKIKVYRCSDFPMVWKEEHVLMDREASDTMVFQKDDRWWMLTNLRPPGCVDFYSRLYLFYADSPLSTDWTPHPLNPIVVDADGGRNAQSG